MFAEILNFQGAKPILGMGSLSYLIKRAYDNKKKLITKRVKIKRKVVKSKNVEWYIAECQNGERLKLKNSQASTLSISIDDIGIVTYRGKVIQSFMRQSVFGK